MTDAEITAGIADAIRAVAPEADVAGLPPDASIRDELDLDSMDVLNVAIGLHERFGIEIGEDEYPELLTLRRCVELVRGKVA